MFAQQPAYSPIFSHIFTQNVPARFLQAVVEAASSMVMEIVTQVTAKLSPTNPLFLPLYKQCLDTVLQWTPKEKYENVQKLTQQCPDIERMYDSTYFQCIQEVSRTSTKQLIPEYQIPTFPDFAYLFMRRVSQDVWIQSLAFTTWSMEQIMSLLSGILRRAVFECIEYITWPRMQMPVAASRLSVTDLKILDARSADVHSVATKSVQLPAPREFEVGDEPAATLPEVEQERQATSPHVATRPDVDWEDRRGDRHDDKLGDRHENRRGDHHEDRRGGRRAVTLPDEEHEGIEQYGVAISKDINALNA